MHDGLTVLRAHRWEDYEATADQPVSEAVFCTVHADAVAEYYCTDCSAMTCLHCIVASHQSHKLERISKSVENYSHLLQTFDNKLAASVDSLTKIVKQKGLYAKKADRLFEDAEENLKDQRREVDAKLDKEENTKLKNLHFDRKRVEASCRAASESTAAKISCKRSYLQLSQLIQKRTKDGTQLHAINTILPAIERQSKAEAEHFTVATVIFDKAPKEGELLGTVHVDTTEVRSPTLLGNFSGTEENGW